MLHALTSYCSDYQFVLGYVIHVIHPCEEQGAVDIHDFTHGSCPVLEHGHSLAAAATLYPRFELFMRFLWAYRGPET
jgi:hypothetical protein